MTEPRKMTVKKNGISLICGDGGIKGGFIAGAVAALIKEFPTLLERIDSISATSASVGSMCYFMSHGRNHPGRKIWTEELASDQFLNIGGASDLFSNKKLYNLDYMVYDIFKNKYPLNIEKIQRGAPKFYFSVQNYATCKVEYFSNTDEAFMERDGEQIPIHNMADFNLYELIKAAGAAPFIFDDVIKLGGVEYMDAATLEPFTMDFPAMKNSKKIVIVTKFEQSFKRKMVYLLSGFLWPFLVNPFRRKNFKRDIYFQYARKPKEIEKLSRQTDSDPDCLVISPSEKLGGIFDNDKATLRNNFEHGEAVVRADLHRISDFLHADL